MRVTVTNHDHWTPKPVVKTGDALQVVINLGMVDTQGTAKAHGIPFLGDVRRVADGQSAVSVHRRFERKVQDWVGRYGGTVTKVGGEDHVRPSSRNNHTTGLHRTLNRGGARDAKWYVFETESLPERRNLPYRAQFVEASSKEDALQKARNLWRNKNVAARPSNEVDARDAIFAYRVKDYSPQQLRTEMQKQAQAFHALLEKAATAKTQELYGEYIAEAKKVARNAEHLRSMLLELAGDKEFKDCSLDGLMEWLTSRNRLDE